MDEDGYLILTNVLTDQDIQFGLSCLQNEKEKVDYVIMKKFIDDLFFKAIQRKVREFSQPKYVKFRFSNNNNSNDASTFHGDVYNYAETELLPIYTGLCYFDHAQIEVIPGSHKYHNKGWSIPMFNQRKVLDVNPGDILLFHSNLHHRGVHFNKQPNRRLLQVFEIFPDQATYDEHASKLVIVQTSSSALVTNVINPVMYQAAKIPVLIEIMTFIHYLLMYNDMHYKIGMMDLEPWNKSGNYVTYEPSRRVYMDETQYEDLNVNVMCDRNIYTAQPSSFYFYVYIVYWIVSFVAIYYFAKWFRGKPKKYQFSNKDKKAPGKKRKVK